MKNFLLLAMLVCALSCGNQIKDDSRFNPIRDQFVKDAKYFGVKADVSKVRIGFYDFNEKVKFLGFTVKNKDNGFADGSCSYLKRDLHNDVEKVIAKTFKPDEYDYAVVRVNQDYKNQSADFLESLVYHELGYCVLNKPHIEAQAIMNSHGVSSFRGARYFYLRELFNNIPVGKFVTSTLTTDMNLNLKLLYGADYVVLKERISYQLFYEPVHMQYYTVEDSHKKEDKI